LALPAHAGARDRRRAGKRVRGRRGGRRVREALRAVSTAVRDLRQGQRPRPEGRRRLHPPLWFGDQDRGRARSSAPSAGRRRSGMMSDDPKATEAATSPPLPPSHQMWGGRFTLGPAEALDALNRSLPVDHRLWPQDVAASKAWVHALGRVGVLSAEEEAQLLDGLDRVAERLADGAAAGAPDEDVHTLVERLLYEEVG